MAGMLPLFPQAINAEGTAGTELNRIGDQLANLENLLQRLATWSTLPEQVGLSHNRGAQDPSGASGKKLPDLLYWLCGVLVFKGEHKASSGELQVGRLAFLCAFYLFQLVISHVCL